MKQAQQKAEAEYDVFNKTQLKESDFDRALKELQQKHGDWEVSR